MPNSFSLVTLLGSILWLAAAAAQETTAADPGRSSADVGFEWGLAIPVRDGVQLNATAYYPDGEGPSPAPTIVTITPYISDRYHPDALYFARSGFNFLIVDTRGRGNSDGQFRPLGLEDGTDGHDVVQWIARQPWSNGKVMMRGGSYGGYNQWATARYFPPALVSIVPIASPYHGVDFPMNYNVPYPYIIRWLTLTAGVTPQSRIFGDDNFWQQKFRRYHTEGLAFSQLDQLVGNPNATFKEWLAHPHADDYWAARVPDAKAYQALDLPILTVTGYYDGDQPGAMTYYARHMQDGSATGKAQHYLLLGPWDHGGTRFPRQSFGGLQFGDEMMIDTFALDRDWYNWTLGQGPRPELLADRVNWFVAGANRWRSAPSLEEVSNQQLTLFLQSTDGASNVAQSGQMTPTAPDAADVDHYVYDPLDTRKVMATPADNYITDQRDVMLTNGDGLIYHSKPFDTATEISGYINLELWLEMNVPDTDVNVTLYEITADGQSIALTGQTQRMRYRHSLSEEQLWQPGRVEQVVFNRFYWMSRQIATGSRLRLFIRPANGLNEMRHYNAAGAVKDQTPEDAQTATVRLHLSPDKPSRLTLPLVVGAD